MLVVQTRQANEECFDIGNQHGHHDVTCKLTSNMAELSRDYQNSFMKWVQLAMEFQKCINVAVITISSCDNMLYINIYKALWKNYVKKIKTSKIDSLINEQFVQSEGRNPSCACTFIPGNALHV